MTNLKALLAANMRERRKHLGITQATLAEKADTATHYITMIELEKRFPSVEMLENIALALEIDTPELFSTQAPPQKRLKQWQQVVLTDINEAIDKVVADHLKELNTL
jgi:transcriptional regulator with XRE-family HTH domain